MRTFFSSVVRHPKRIFILFILAALAGALLQALVKVNYDMKDYLPADSPSTTAINVMDSAFGDGIPNARVLIEDVSIPEALAYKDRLLGCEGVTAVIWLDDVIDIKAPLEWADAKSVEAYYKDQQALLTLTIDRSDMVGTVQRVQDIIGPANAMSGDAVSTALATTGTLSEITKISIISVLAVLLILMITTTAWAEPAVVLVGLGIAILINNGSNLIFGEISFVTNAAGAILQLAVSLDYSVFLIHRFEECLAGCTNRHAAMVDALCKSASAILSSGLTTVIGFLALVFMRFGIGPDLGLALAKGIAISLITVFIYMPALILTAYPLIEKTRHRGFMPTFRGFGRQVTRLMIPMVFVFTLLAVPAALAANANTYYYGASHIYGPETRLGQDRERIEAAFGKKETDALMVPDGNPEQERLLSDALQAIPAVSSVISYTDTVGPEVPRFWLDPDQLSRLISSGYTRMILTVETDSEGKDTFDLVQTIRDTANRYYPGAYQLAGESVSTYDLMDTITSDTLKVNLIAVGAVFIVLLLTIKSLSLPIILVFAIEAAIWINMGIPYFSGTTVQYIAYLIISSIQLGATVDYAILFTDRYLDNRRRLNKRDAVIETVSAVTTSVLTSGSALSLVGFLLHFISTHGILSQLGLFLGRGTLLSMTSVFLVLPGLLWMFDGLIQKTSLNLRLNAPGKES